MITLLLLEDELYTRRFLESIVATSPLVTNLLDTAGGEEAIGLCKKFKPEIALLDIELDPIEGMNGIEVAKKILDISPGTQFIFVTGYSQYALDSFSVHPFDYILKPVKREKLLSAINTLAGEIIKNNMADPPAKIMIKSKKDTLYLVEQDIIFVERVYSDTFIHCRNGQVYQTRHSLSELERKLGKYFLRLHKSYIVNLKLIKKIADQGNRSFCISFHDTEKNALMSRYKFEEYKNVLAHL